MAQTDMVAKIHTLYFFLYHNQLFFPQSYEQISALTIKFFNGAPSDQDRDTSEKFFKVNVVIIVSVVELKMR